MMKKIALLNLSAQKINRQHVQMILTFIAIILMVLGIGAPSDGSGPK